MAGRSTSRRIIVTTEEPIMKHLHSSTLPLRAGTIPEMVIRVVLLPAPLAPIRVMISPSLISILTSLMARIFPYPAWIFSSLSIDFFT